MSACEKTWQVYRGSGACSLREISYSEIASRPLLGQNSHYSPTKIFRLV